MGQEMHKNCSKEQDQGQERYKTRVTVQRSLALVVCKPFKNENVSLNFKVSVFSVAPVEFVAL